jgi:hypothetical protein
MVVALGVVAALGLVGRYAGQRVLPDAQAGHGTEGMARPGAETLNNFHLHVCAFHVAKNNPKFQIEAYHYCGPHGESLHQCVIYDKYGANAKLLGVEYIITDELYRTLPDSEKKYYHPHTYEILAGQLIAPAFSTEEEDGLMRVLLTTWGKTWHTWPDPTTPVPMGEPLLMWSVTGDGQLDPALLASRDKKFNVSSDAIREHRKSYGFKAPNIPPPASVDAIGRRWTVSGRDEPTTTGDAKGTKTVTAQPGSPDRP